jgi:electron transport complex protein RnfE
MKKFFKQFINGLWNEVPVFRVVLGLCPTIAVSTCVENAIGMGMAATFVLVCSNVVISALRKLIPSEVRIPCYIVVIATFVTVTDLIMNAFVHDLHKALGIFIPLIVVNCIIMGRAEAFAGKNAIPLAFADGMGMGIGFTLALVVIAACRELLGNGTITIWGNIRFVLKGYEPAVIMIMAPGGFLTLGCLLGCMNQIQAHLSRKSGVKFSPPQISGCRHCVMCKLE